MKKLSLVLVLVLGGLWSLAAQRTVTGTVTDAQGDPLIGATVLVKGTTSGTVTGIDGGFSISAPADGGVLVFSYTGFASQEVPIGTQSTINVSLEESASQLNEVVVIGYGEQSRARVTSNISSVGTEAFDAVPATTVEGALSGRMAGVHINGNSGALGAQNAIRVRGVGSINADVQPLFVVDGLILNDDA